MEERAILPWLSVSEPVSSLSHLASAIVVALLASRLLEKAGPDRRRRRAVWLYLFGVGGMFVASGTYHFLDNESPHRDLFWRLDHAMIWCTIAGTISAVQVLAGIALGWRGYVVWALAITGCTLEQLTLDGLSMWVSPMLYVGMGWYGLFPFFQLVRTQGLKFAMGVMRAGLTSTLGGVCDALKWPEIWPGVIEGHEVMHVLIAWGMLQFYWAVTECANLPFAPYLEQAQALAAEAESGPRAAE
ncbi:MAG: hemolysin III family protein [Planctomycetota bacterium]